MCKILTRMRDLDARRFQVNWGQWKQSQCESSPALSRASIKMSIIKSSDSTSKYPLQASATKLLSQLCRWSCLLSRHPLEPLFHAYPSQILPKFADQYSFSNFLSLVLKDFNFSSLRLFIVTLLISWASVSKRSCPSGGSLRRDPGVRHLLHWIRPSNSSSAVGSAAFHSDWNIATICETRSGSPITLGRNSMRGSLTLKI